MTKFGEILMQLRQEKHLSQAELGHIIYADVEKLVRLADYFNVSIDYLLGRSTSKLSPDVFAQTVSDDTTVGDVVQSLQRLSPARKRAACTMVADMEVASMIHIAGKRERA